MTSKVVKNNSNINHSAQPSDWGGMWMIKKITLPIFFVFSIYSLYGQKDTVIYANDNNTIVKEKGQIKNGKKIGVWKEFYTDEENKGLIKREHFYNSRGFSYKVKNYYDKNCNNIISGIGNYKEEIGFSVSHGKTIHYYCNGNIEYISFYRNGSSLYSKSYYENGNIKGMQKHIIDTGGERRGKWIRGYENGNIKEKGKFKNDLKIGMWKQYFENGQLKSKGKYIPKEKRIPEGDITKNKILPDVYSINDSLIKLGYEDLVYDKFNSIMIPIRIFFKTGKWKYWDEAGNLIRVQIWKKGELLEDKKYNQKGILIKEEFWEEGILKESKEYDEEGNLMKN